MLLLLSKKDNVLNTVDLKRITRCKLALIFESANHRKFLGLFGSKADEATIEGYAIKMLWFFICMRPITVTQ